MNRITYLRPEFVEFIPEHLDNGVLYISRRYSTASHLCCCGCKHEVVTPLNPAKWHLTERNGSVSLTPSIGNWSFPCKSHYWITHNRIRWAGSMSAELIVEVKARDKHDAERLAPEPVGIFALICQKAEAAWKHLHAMLSGWWRK